jgi:glutamate-1-semialdehyde 2,1-aminomutase
MCSARSVSSGRPLAGPAGAIPFFSVAHRDLTFCLRVEILADLTRERGCAASNAMGRLPAQPEAENTMSDTELRNADIDAALAEAKEAYVARNPRSFDRFVEATAVMPGGNTRTVLHYAPFPIGIARGEGCRLWDLDGAEYIDFLGEYTAGIYGHSHPVIRAAVDRALDAGINFGGSNLIEAKFARAVCGRFGLERVRFTNSGTEAVMMAVRAARRFTGRRRIAKLEGGYHGTSEDVVGSEHPDLVILPADDAVAAVALLERQARELAAVLVEPVQGSAGMLALDLAYLRTLREATRRLGILLVFDEVVSVRVSYGGAEEHFGVKPDMCCLGKLIGGGLPLGAFGGREEIMELFDPSRGPPVIPHPGSYNANPVSLAAGLATMELLTREAVERLNAAGERLRTALDQVFVEAGVPASVTGLGSLFGIHLTEGPVRTIRDAARADAPLRHRIFLALYVEGILIDPRGVGTLSTAIGDAEIEEFLAALRSVLSRLRQPALS